MSTSRLLLIAATAAVMAAVGFVSPAHATYPARNRLIAYPAASRSGYPSNIAANGGLTLSARMAAYLKGLATGNELSGAVLVAQSGKTLLSQGYGMADREKHVSNTPATKYPVGGVSFSISVAVALKLEEQGKIRDGASVCSYLSSCPKSWKPMTIHKVLNGTSGLGDAGWGQSGHTTAQSLAHCQREPISASPSYQNCTPVVLGTIFQKVMGEPWESIVQQEIFRPAGMNHSGRVTDSLVPPMRARDYSGSNPGGGNAYNDYFQIYATAPDVYAYDNALFGGKLISRASLTRLFTPRGSVIPPDNNVANDRQASEWKVGFVVGHSMIFTTGNTNSFTVANLRFPHEGVTVIVISNDDQNNVEAVAVQLASMVFGKALPQNVQTAPAVAPAKAIVASINAPHAFGAMVTSGNGAPPVFGEDCCGGNIAVGAASVWTVAGSGDRTLVRIDPQTNRALASLTFPRAIGPIAMGSGAVWVESHGHL